MPVFINIIQFFYRFLDRFEASYTKRIIFEAIQLLGQLWIYLVIGIILSTVIKMYISKARLAGFFANNRQKTSILIASLIGVVSPLGSYVIIPMSAVLLGIGVPLPVLMALMVSSPLINPNLFVLTAGAMGIEMAVLRAVSAFILGCVAGYSTLWFEKARLVNPAHILKKTHFSGDGTTTKKDENKLTAFFTELYKMTKFVSKYFFLALILAAILKIAVNPKIIVKLFDSDNILSVLLSTAAGVPFYVCGGAAIPVVEQLADMGMSKGAVLAYFISGPITKISNLVVLHATFRGIVLIQYVTIGIVGAILFGLFYNLF
ncbi:MAG: permease [Prolixibacteraceae bacterium]|nr:permease [Prolixibacteraceae bacterium]